MQKNSLKNEEVKLISKEKELKVSFRHTNLRWLALVLACLMLFGDSQCFDNPMALQDDIKDKMGISQFQFNLLYSVYSFPNIILPFFGGLLIDYIGVRTGVIIFSTLLIIGQGVVALAGFMNTYYLMIIGRIIFGMGSESLMAAQGSIISMWFKDKELSVALGMSLSLPKIGSASNSLVSPIIEARSKNLGIPLLVGVGVCTFSWICGLILIQMDRESDRREELAKEYATMQTLEVNKFSSSEKPTTKSRSLQSLGKNQSEFGKGLHKSSISSTTRTKKSQSLFVKFSTSSEFLYVAHEEQVEAIKFDDLKRLNSTFWILLVICMFTEALFVPFLDNGNEYFQVRYKFSRENAGQLLMIPYLLAAVLTPIMGRIVDRIGRRVRFIIMTCAVFLSTHVIMLLLECKTSCIISALPLFMLGVCYSLQSSVVIPSVPVVVDPRMIGTAFGIMGVLQNTALAVFPLLTGLIYEENADPTQGGSEDQGQYYQSMFFVGMSVMTLVIAFTLYFFDKNGGRLLNKPNFRNEFLEKHNQRHTAIEDIHDISKNMHNNTTRMALVEEEAIDPYSPQPKSQQNQQPQFQV